MVETKEILGIKISNVTMEEGLEEVLKWLVLGTGKHYIVTPGSEFLVRAQKDLEFKRILNKADLALPDGIGVIWASKILGHPLRKRVAGTDFMEKLCEVSAKKGFRTAFLGGGPGVALKAVECLKKKFPGLKTVWVGEGRTDSHCLNDFGSSAIDILFVAFGAPKQEKWISKNLPKLPVKVAMGVGGAFDFFSGRVTRAPKWVQNLGFEWFFRLLRQPWRLKRQLSLVKFIIMVLKVAFKGHFKGLSL